jgi:hypothetical protein
MVTGIFLTGRETNTGHPLKEGFWHEIQSKRGTRLSERGVFRDETCRLSTRRSITF